MAQDTPQSTSQSTPDFNGLRLVPIDEEPTYDPSKQKTNPKDIPSSEPLQLQPSTNKTLPSAVAPLPTPKDILKTTVEGVKQAAQATQNIGQGPSSGSTIQEDIHDLVSGAMKAGTVPMMFAAAVDPMLAAQGLAESTGAQVATEQTAKMLGASPETAQAAGDIAAVAVPSVIHATPRPEGSAFLPGSETGALKVGTETDKEIGGDPFQGLRVQEEPKTVYRARPEGQEGITVTQGSHAHATASESEAHGYRQNLDEMSAQKGENVTHKVDAIDLSKVPADQYTIMKGPNGHDWVRFNQDQPESIFQKAEEKTEPAKPKERTTGDTELDARIKEAGGVPGGVQKGFDYKDKETGETKHWPDMAYVHHESGSTLNFPMDASKEDIKAGLDAKTKEYADAAKKNEPHWSEKAAEDVKNNNGFSYNPKTGEAPKNGYMVEVHPEGRQVLDHPATAQDIRDFADKHKDLFEKHPELHVGGYGNELNVSANVTPKLKNELKVAANIKDVNAAKRLAKTLDQKSIWDVKGQKEIETGDSGVRTDFSNYPIEERMSDIRGETKMGPEGFEHLPARLHDYMEPDEREFVKGNKRRQQNITDAYRSIKPSLEETTNSMNAGAMNAGWWQRFMDTFKLVGGKDADTGVEHAEALKQWHSALSGNKNVADAANLAGHSYIDWLDAGKPTDRKSINDIIKKNGAQPQGAEKKGNAALSDTIDKNGKVINKGIDTTKILNLVNSPEMRGEKPFTGEVFGGTNPLRGVTPGAIKIPSMGATTAGKGNLNRLVLDAHGLDFYGQNGWTDATYIAHSIHMRHAAEALGLKGGEGQEQQWGVILGLKELLKEGMTPEEAAKGITDNFILQKGKDYAKIIKDDPESNAIFERLKSYGTKSATEIQSGLDKILSGRPVPREETGVNQTLLADTAKRIRETIAPSKIKKVSPKVRELENKGLGGLGKSEEDDTSFNFGANVKSVHEENTAKVAEMMKKKATEKGLASLGPTP